MKQAKLLATVGLLFAFEPNVNSTPIRAIPGLTSITFYEVTNTTNLWTFAVNSSELTTRRSDPLSSTNKDFEGVLTIIGNPPNIRLVSEDYDVFYSDANGAFNIDGDFLTIEAAYPLTTGGGGLNIAEVQFNFSSSSIFAGSVTSFVQMGPNAVVGSQAYAVDGDLSTFTVMGSTPNYPSDPTRLRITVTAPTPEPSTILLTGLALALLLGHSPALCRRNKQTLR